jgi:hypothetical protein
MFVYVSGRVLMYFESVVKSWDDDKQAERWRKTWRVQSEIETCKNMESKNEKLQKVSVSDSENMST